MINNDLNCKIMKKTNSSLLFLVPGLFLLNFSLTGQETPRVSPSLSPEISKIVTASCMPCHSKDGGFKSRFKLNFTDWAKYSPEKQKAKAERMYSRLDKGEMPPKKAREAKPETIPTREQIETIKKWAESLKTE